MNVGENSHFPPSFPPHLPSQNLTDSHCGAQARLKLAGILLPQPPGIEVSSFLRERGCRNPSAVWSAPRIATVTSRVSSSSNSLSLTPSSMAAKVSVLRNGFSVTQFTPVHSLVIWEGAHDHIRTTVIKM